MPKWGLAMTQGKVIDWLVAEGVEVSAGAEIVEVETEKITGNVESPISGLLRRRVAQSGENIPVGGLLGVFADNTVPDADIDQFVEGFEVEEAEEEGEDSGGERPEFVETCGRRLRHLKRGAGGTPAVLIHGFSGNINNWLFNHTALAEHRAVYAVELPGHGQSTKDVGDGSLDMFVDSVGNWLDAVGIKSAHFVGHSMGGAIAMGLAERWPDRVTSCSLIASVGLGREIDHEYLTGVVAAERRKQLKPHLESQETTSDK